MLYDTSTTTTAQLGSRTSVASTFSPPKNGRAKARASSAHSSMRINSTSSSRSRNRRAWLWWASATKRSQPNSTRFGFSRLSR